MDEPSEAALDQSSVTTEPAESARNVWWWIALLIATLPTVLTVFHLRQEGWRICPDVVAQVGDVAVVDRPPDATDFLVVLFPVAVLLFPHVAELTIPGVISLKRRVENQEREQRVLERQITRVQQQVSQTQSVVTVFSSDNFANKVIEFLEKQAR